MDNPEHPRGFDFTCKRRATAWGAAEPRMKLLSFSCVSSWRQGWSRC